MTNYRALTFSTKEPETLKWIESFAPNSILLDIGANIGIYSLYAAKLSHKVISIEPDALNFALLSLNVNDNKLQNLISTYCCAAGSKFGLERLASRSECWGGALKEISYNKNLEINSYLQDIIIIDPILLANPIFFGSEELHLKVDVDGNEDQIIFDGCNLLELKNLSSILIELDVTNINYQSIISNINRCDFTLGGIYSCTIVGAEFNNMKNHIFYKNK
jgi:FkbM family methyltransferase